MNRVQSTNVPDCLPANCQKQVKLANKPIYIPIYYTNIRSLASKRLELEYLINNLVELPIFVFTETWLSSTNDIVFLFNLGYCVYRVDREWSGGGGCAVCVPQHLQVIHEPSKNHSSPYMEAMFLDIVVPSGKTRLINIYRPPGALKGMPEALVSYIEGAMQDKIPTLIFGDFNYPNINWEDCVASSKSMGQDIFLERMLLLGLTQQISDSTHIHGNVLDLLFTSEPNLLQNISVQPPIPGCDHNLVTSLFCLKPEFATTSPRFQFSKGNYDALDAALAQVDWSLAFLGVFDIDKLWKIFSEITFNYIEQFVPKCTFSSSYQKFHWPKWVRELHKRQKLLYKKYKRTGDINLKRQYQEAARCARRSKRNYIAERESQLVEAQNFNLFFSYVRSKLSYKPGIPCLTDKSGELLLTSEAKAAAFSDHFSSVFTIDDGSRLNFPKRLENQFPHSIDLSPEVVHNYLKNLPSKLSLGPDGLPSMFFKKLSVSLAEPLSYIFNYSFIQGKIPHQWSTATVSPIFKNKGSTSLASNYRPISLTCVACKVMESIIRDNLVFFLNENHLISAHQHGFVSGKSTVTQLIECLNSWYKSLDERKAVDVIYLDFSKAFDTVSHQKLLQKLPSYGITGPILRWLEAFLLNRRQRVTVDGVCSKWSEIPSGVPQGSVLGPLLFLLYINDITDLNLSGEIKLFADDVKLFAASSSPYDFSPLVSDLSKVAAWAEKNQLTLALTKSQVLHLGHKNPNQVYSLDNVILPTVKEIKDLGVYLASDLKPHFHCQKLFASANQISALIFKSFENKCEKFLFKLFQVYVRPKLEYASPVWNPCFQTDIDLIEKIQRRFTKRIPGLSELSYDERLKKLSAHSLKTRRLILDLTLLYKILNNLTSLDPDALFVQDKEGTTRGHSRKLYVQRAHLDLYRYFYVNRVVSHWNGLPESIVSAPSLHAFKLKLGAHYSYGLGDT